jgi:phospholipase/lecithinase/hemolysin
VSRKKVFTIIKFSSLLILLGVFFLSIVVTVFTFSKPQSVIDLIEPLVPTVTPAPLKMNGMVVLGDSQSDEYRADDNRGNNYPGYTLNWVELLQKYRGVNVGEWGTREEPRRTGYEYNWARTGATARSMIESGQNTGAAQQIKEGKANVAVIFIGAIDFAPYLTDQGYEHLYNGELSDPAKKSKVNRIIADIKTAVYTLKDAGNVRILLVKIPDWGNHLGVQVAFPFPDQREQVSDVIDDANSEIDKLAQDENLLTLDPNALYKELIYESSNGKMKVDGVTIERLILNNDPKNFYLEDGVHTGTVVNGFLANAIIAKVNMMISNDIKPFSQKEIRSAAGL